MDNSEKSLKVLIICGGNYGSIDPFITERVDALRLLGVEFAYFLVKGNGVMGYLKNFPHLRRKIREFNPNLVHAHYGLSGLLAVLQQKVPVVITFHGSDINHGKHRPLSRLAHFLSRKSIFVTSKLAHTIQARNPMVIPCGVNFDGFYTMLKEEVRQKLGWDLHKKYILFSGSFQNKVKNYPLAQAAIELLGPDIELIELKGLNREQVCQYLNAVDCALMTSFTEGSPQFIKEAMACNCPIVTTDVGSVKEIIKDTEGCFISNFEPEVLASKISQAFDFGRRTEGRLKIQEYDNRIIASKIHNLYQELNLGVIKILSFISPIHISEAI